MKWINTLLILIFNAIALTGYAQKDTLRIHINNLLKAKQATVGVGIINLETGDTMTIGNKNHYPMQSTYKFHVALAVLTEVDKGRFSLDQKILVTKKDLLPNTVSPLRDKYPKGNVNISLREILSYTISQSDNNGCDLLFRLLGGPRTVDAYIHNLGINDISIKYTEDEMHKSWKTQFSNWTTPYAGVQLLQLFYAKNILSKASYDFLWETMVNTTTGPDRLKGQLPIGTVLAHKTGTSGRSDNGIRAAVNDIGIITLPNGKHIAIAIYVSNSTETDESNAKIIADIAKMVYDYYIKTN